MNLNGWIFEPGHNKKRIVCWKLRRGMGYGEELKIWAKSTGMSMAEN